LIFLNIVNFVLQNQLLYGSISCNKDICVLYANIFGVMLKKYGAEHLRIAKERNLNFHFEASVGVGIPIIHPLDQSWKCS
jgi:homoserine dehydrogenase